MHEHSFDERAATWDDDPAKRDRSHSVAECIRQAVALTPQTRMLEYGAGTGLVTQALRASVGPVTLADTSAGMRKVMEDKIAAGALTDARVWDVDLATDDPPDAQFDLIVTVMTLHHIPNLDPVLTRFNALLADGGHLCVVDLDKEDGSFHGQGFEGHQGFETSWLAAALAAAGFGEITAAPCANVTRDGAEFPLFLMTATARHDGRMTA